MVALAAVTVTAATVKFTATVCPTAEGSGVSLVIVVVVLALLTV